MRKICFGFCSFFVFVCLSFVPPHQNNTAPEIRFIEPLATQFSWNSGITYRLQVTDKEDGSSLYEEIVPGEVFLMVRYLSDSARLKIFLMENAKDRPVLTLLTSNHCFNCHSIKNKLAGPSFESISAKYGAGSSSISYLADKIRQGSKGVWGDSQQMPSHPNISETEAQTIVRWLLRNASDPGFDYIPGLEGTIRFPANPGKSGKGIYVLQANYTDHGINGRDSKNAAQVLVLKPR